MNSNKKTARIAGAFYLVVVVTGIFSLMYVPSTLIDWNDASRTFQNIQSSETLFRLGILASIICYIAFLFLPLVLYKLLSEVNKTQAIAMVALAVASVPVSLVNLLNKFAVLTLIAKPESFETTQLHAQVLLNLNYYNNGIHIASVFWGLWLFPFGYLVYKSGLLPKVLGIFLMAGCIGYIINSFGSLVSPIGYKELGIASILRIPASIGEIGICLWLLIMGAKEKAD